MRAQSAIPSPAAGDRLDGSVALDRALSTSSLTVDGKPFHAILAIGSADSPFSGQVEVWWVAAARYRVAITSPGFSQVKTVNGDQVQEKTSGAYLPRWLENFVLALLDPAPVAENFRGSGPVVVGQGTQGCLSRDDRPNGITDQTTWGRICFTGTEPRLSYVLTFNDSMEFSDWEKFGRKQIARHYQTNVLDFRPVVGRLTTLEDLRHPDEAMFTVTAATPPDQRIATTFVSTLTAESLLEKAPAIEWPPVREGRTEGYMIVYARTDRTGQVREAAKHNSDQPGLENFGIEQALRYKFKPLIVNGVAEQMEMPLVLHFSSHLEDPLPILTVAEMKQQAGSCDFGTLPPGTPPGTVVRVRVSVNETGRVTGISPLGHGNFTGLGGAMEAIRACQFQPYRKDGKVTYYKGDINLMAP